MFKSYLKTAWRNILKNRVFSFINVLGLSIGLTCCMFISLYLWHETRYDSHHENIERLYQVGTIFISNQKEERWATNPSPLADVMKMAFPQIEATARLIPARSEDKTLLQYNTTGGAPRSYYEDKGFLADSGFFRLFTYDFIEGNPAVAMNNPYSIVLSEDIARKIFGKEPALNKIIHVNSNTNGEDDYIVTGVFRPSTAPSHIDGRFFLSMYGGVYGEFIRKTTNLAQNNLFYTYILLKPGSDPGLIERQFPAFVDKYEGKELRERGYYKKQFLIPVRDIHLHSGMNEDITPSGSATYLYILATVAIFTMLIACINFMNLSTARSYQRSAEVGIRKTLGAKQSSLVWQFLGESFMMAVMAYVIAIGLVLLAMPVFEKATDRDIQLSIGQVMSFVAIFFPLALLSGLFAGIYPAFYLSSFKPATILKGKQVSPAAVASFRKGLVIFQFVISVILIVASAVIARQMSFLRHADLGFDKDQQVVIPLRSNQSRNMYASLKSELERNPQVLDVGGCIYYPGINNSHDQLLYIEGKTPHDGHDTKLNLVDFNFLQTLNIRLVAGRLFSLQFPADSIDGIILNEEAVRLFGYSPDRAIGKKVYNNFGNSFMIVGVVKDFHFEDLRTPIGAFGFQVNKVPVFNYVIVHLRPGDVKASVAAVKETWHRLDPDEPLEYNFLDQQFQMNYKAEEQVSAIVGYFTGIAICISCLGLFGLAAFSAEQRTKEIGIRKALGASSTHIVVMLSKDFLKLVGIAILIASPIAWFIMHRWLQDFAYRTTINWSIFLLTTAVILFISILTTSLQAIRAALANPVKSIRTQ